MNGVPDVETADFVRQLDAQLRAINTQLKTAPPEFRQPVGYATIEIGTDIANIETPEQLHALAERYRTDTTNQPTALKLIRTQIIERIDAHQKGFAPTDAPSVQQLAPQPTQRIIETSPRVEPYVEKTRGVENKEPYVIDRSQVSEPKRNVRDIAPQRGELVVFRNGDQNRWGIIEQRGNLEPSQNKHQHPDGWQDAGGWRLKPNDQGSHYQLRVTGIARIIPASTITHTIDPKQQPDLPVDSIIEKGSATLRVQSITWGNDAERLRSLAAGKPSMIRQPHTTDGFDLRDGIGTNNERNDPADRHKQTNYRDDQQADVEYVRSNPKNGEQHQTRERLTPSRPGATRLPTAGPHAMAWAANLDKVDPNQTRIIVTGSRDLGPESAELIKTTLETKLAGTDPATITIVHGAARGADQLAVQAARELGMSVEPHRADWNLHGKAAGPIRNQQMINAGADHVIAFFNKPLAESKGTSDMVGRARHKGIPIDVINVPTLTKTVAPTVTPTPTPVQPAAPTRSLSR